MIWRVISRLVKITSRVPGDPRKNAVAAVLGIAALVIGLKLVTGGRAPSAVNAGDRRASISRTDSSAPQPATIVASHNIPSTNTPAAPRLAPPKIVPLQRNLFAVPIESFPMAAAHPKVNLAPKATTLLTEAQEQRQALVERTRVAAAGLKMQSTMTMPGTQPTALVNGTLIHQGSVISGFKILRIESRQMIVERDGVKLEIIMK